MGGMIENYIGAESSQPNTSLDVADLILSTDSTVLNFYDNQRSRLQKFATTYLQEAAQPVIELVSSGSTVITDAVKSTRTAFQDFERMQITNQWWKYSNDPAYLAHTTQMIVDWSKKNIPDGQPINQTHFCGMHIVLRDLASYGVNAYFDSGDWINFVKPWLQAILAATIAWPYTPSPGDGQLQYGNHYSHGLQQRLMCAYSLGDTAEYNNTLSLIDTHATNNMPYGNAAILYPPCYAIVTVNTALDYVEIAGNHTAAFTAGALQCLMHGSFNSLNDYNYNVVSSAIVGSNTRITLSRNGFLGNVIPSGQIIIDSTVQGTIAEPYNALIHDMPRVADIIGESIDFIRRDAFHYQNYDLQPWLNIAITEGGTRYETLVDNAFAFLWNKHLSETDYHCEFQASSDDFDSLRYIGSQSEYLQPRTYWISDEGARSIMNYYLYKWTLHGGSFTANEGLMGLLTRGDRISTETPYYLRLCLGL